jgi:hypothetical protein
MFVLYIAAGSPDEFVKKSPEMYPKTFFVKVNVSLFHEKGQKCAYFCKKTALSKESPKILPNLVIRHSTHIGRWQKFDKELENCQREKRLLNMLTGLKRF